jgi:hypothetical protein
MFLKPPYKHIHDTGVNKKLYTHHNIDSGSLPTRFQVPRVSALTVDPAPPPSDPAPPPSRGNLDRRGGGMPA